MEARKFKAGDRVIRRSDGQEMEVVNYAREHHAFLHDRWSEHDVVCVWYDEYKNRHKEVYNQRSLAKIEDAHSLFAT